MGTTDPDDGPPRILGHAGPPIMTAPRTRIGGGILLVACLLAVIGAVLPWVTAVNINLTTGATSRLFTWGVWMTPLGVLFVLFVFPLLYLLLAGLDAVRGRPPRLTRRSAVLLALIACLGTVLFAFVMELAAGFATFNPYWLRGSSTDVSLESGAYVTLAGYAVAFIASWLLPARRTKKAGA